ncbi:hypothetical protein [Streptomyces sp. NPDC059092]|uniref:AbiTii domain-containing protein n=1 Tax=Streptomyces sp. NPDC059092 TaxID=3346725 RepID=UPI00367A3EE4
MTTSDVRGLEQLERAVLDDTASLASALRQCLMLAGYAHHEELRAWALKELKGYPAADELPSYRKVPAEPGGADAGRRRCNLPPNTCPSRSVAVIIDR